MNAPTTLTQLRQPATALATAEPDYSVDLFSVRGLKLAIKLCEMFAESDAVPVMFRRVVLKKSRDGDVWVDNPSAMGNCLVAVETARSVGMSITSVMQNANIIEGKLSWAAQFWISAINASRRFTPLRFDLQNRGRIKAKYREKLGWNNAKKGFDFAEREVEVEDHACVAWALPYGFQMPPGVYTLDQARAKGLPVIESSPVSMRMAVEEGWYSKPGSKWQTEMRHQMLQYRAGAFFGRIHAPDIVMGMGRTAEEIIDTQTIDMAPDGTVAGVTTEQLRRQAGDVVPAADVVQAPADVTPQDAGAAAGVPQGELDRMADAVGAGQDPDAPPAFDADAYATALEACKTVDALDQMADQLRDLQDADMRQTMTDIYTRRREVLVAAADKPAAATQAPGRRTRPTQAPE